MVLLGIACTLLHGHGRCVRAAVPLVLPLVSDVGELCVSSAQCLLRPSPWQLH